MKKVIIFATLGIMGIAAIAQEVAPDIWNFKLGVAKQSKTKYDNSIALAKKEYDNKLTAAKAELAVDLRKAAKIALELNEVDEALKIQSAIKEVQKDIIPAPTLQPKAIVQNSTAIKGKWTVSYQEHGTHTYEFEPNGATYHNHASSDIIRGKINFIDGFAIVSFSNGCFAKFHTVKDMLYGEWYGSEKTFASKHPECIGIGTRVK